MIYLDNAATTEPNAEALARAVRFAAEHYQNPSALYGGGLAVQSALKEAREKLLFLAAGGAGGEFELIFTSGGTEADNQAIFCGGRRGNVVTTAGEHAAVYRSATELRNRGVEPRFAPLKKDGSVDGAALLSLVDEKTSLVSVVHVNNETGAVNDILSLAREVKRKNPRCLFHSDGVQAFGKIPFALGREIDLYSVSAHKIGGLKGTGALIKRKSLALAPYLYGGGQEGNLRSGTENVPGILAFAYAAEDRFRDLGGAAARLENCREALFSALDGALFTRISPEDGSPYILTVAARGLRGEVLQRMLEERGVIVGTGSACSSKKPHSRVIEACGYGNDISDGVLRVSFSPATTEEEAAAAARAMNGAAAALKTKIG